MSEQDSGWSHEEEYRLPETPLKRLSFDLDSDADYAHSYDSLIMSLQTYLEQDFNLNGRASSVLVKEMFENGAFPPIEEFEEDYVTAVIQLRLGIFAYVSSLGADMGKINNSNTWLADLATFAVGSHNAVNEENCGNFKLDVEPEFDCDYSICPAKVIPHFINDMIDNTDCSSDAYKFFPENTVWLNIEFIYMMYDVAMCEHDEIDRMYEKYKNIIESNLPKGKSILKKVINEWSKES